MRTSIFKHSRMSFISRTKEGRPEVNIRSKMYSLVMLLLVVFLSLLGSTHEDSASAAEMYGCLDNRSLPQYVAGEPLELCCKLLDEKPIGCPNTSWSDSLHIDPPHTISSSFNVTRLSRCEVKLVIENASVEDSGRYFCKRNDKTMYWQTVYLIDKPTKPIITKIICTTNKNITLVFDRGVPSDKWNDKYEISITEVDNCTDVTTVMCYKDSSTSTCRENESLCTCSYLADKGRPADQDVIFTVNVFRSSSVYVTTQETHNLMKYILPGPLKGLQVNPTAVNASISFCQDGPTELLYRHMFINDQPLLYHMRVVKSQGIAEELKLKVEVDSMWNSCIQFQLANLTAFTEYTVIVWGSGGGGEGLKTSKKFRTNIGGVPSYPPSKVRFVTYNFNMSQPGLIVMWQPLPHEAQRGPNLTYSCEVSASDGFNKTITDISEMYVPIMNRILPAGPLKVKIWAHNAVGRSENYTEITIPPRSELVQPKMYVEWDVNKARVFVSGANTSKNLTFHVCKGHWDDKLKTGICHEYPKTKTYDIVNSEEYHVVLDGDKKPGEMQENRLVTFYPIESLNSPLNESYTTVANVTIHASGDSLVVNDYDYEDLGEEDNTNYYDPSLARNVPVPATENFLFLSEEIRETPSSLIPARCYFDKSKNSINHLNLRPIYEDSNNQGVIKIQIEQDCHTHQPQEFLAEAFGIAPSETNNCQHDSGKVTRVQYNVFQPAEGEVPKNTTYVCVSVYKNSTYTSEKSFSEFLTDVPEGKISSSEEELVIPLVVSVTVFVLLAVAIIGAYCRWRRGHVKSYMPSKPVINMDYRYKNGNLPQSDVEDAPEVPERPKTNDKDRSGINVSGDSGRGTASTDGTSKGCSLKTETSFLSETGDTFRNPRADDNRRGSGESNRKTKMNGVREVGSGVKVHPNTNETLSQSGKEDDGSGSGGHSTDVESFESGGDNESSDIGRNGQPSEDDDVSCSNKQRKLLKMQGFTFKCAGSDLDNEGSSTSISDEDATGEDILDDGTDEDCSNDISAADMNSPQEGPTQRPQTDSDQTRKNLAIKQNVVPSQEDRPAFDWQRSISSGGIVSESDSDVDCDKHLLK